MAPDTQSLFIAALEVIKSPVMTNLTPSFYLLNACSHTIYFSTLVAAATIFLDLANQAATQLSLNSLDSQLLICETQLTMLYDQLTELFEMQTNPAQLEFSREELLDYIRILQEDKSQVEDSVDDLRRRRDAMRALLRSQIDESASRFSICKKIVFWSPVIGLGLGLIGLGVRYAIRGSVLVA